MSGIAQQPTAAAEWRQHWPLVIASTAGFSLHTVSSYAIGLFMEPLSAEFGWTRAQISVVTLIPGLLMILFSPSIGGLIDRWGSRRMAVPSIALTGITLALVGTATGSMVQWYLLWFAYGAVSLGIKTTVWTTAISGAFDTGRGLALGVTLTGTAIAQIAVPPLTYFLIEDYGWRMAYVWLGLGWAAPCLILAILFLYDARDQARMRPAKASAAPPPPVDLPGLTLGQALRDRPLQRIGASTLLTMFLTTAVLIHQVPILTASGVDRADAAWLASLAGAAGIIGKLTTGWMTDRWNAATIGMISLTVPAVAYWILMDAGQSTALTIFAMMIIGYTMGTKLQITAYLTARYAGMRNYGRIFGVMTSMIGIGGGLGTVAAGAVFDMFGNYDILLIFGVASSFVCGGLLWRLGRYPDWSQAAAPQPA